MPHRRAPARKHSPLCCWGASTRRGLCAGRVPSGFCKPAPPSLLQEPLWSRRLLHRATLAAPEASCQPLPGVLHSPLQVSGTSGPACGQECAVCVPGRDNDGRGVQLSLSVQWDHGAGVGLECARQETLQLQERS